MKVLISLSSFGAAETGRHGQLWCTNLAQQAGADGVEVRGELLRVESSHDERGDVREVDGRVTLQEAI